MTEELEKVIFAINDKKCDFFNRHIDTPNTIVINAKMLSMFHDYFIGGVEIDNKQNPIIYGMRVILSDKVKSEKDIQVALIKINGEVIL